MTRIFVRPMPGRVIPMPDGNGDLPAEGKAVNRSSYWTRREQQGDVEVLVDRPTVAEVPSNAPAAETPAATESLEDAAAADAKPAARKTTK